MLREIIKEMNEEVSDDDVQYWSQLADDAQKTKKTEKEGIKILKDAGCPQDIIADLTQRWGKGRR